MFKLDSPFMNFLNRVADVMLVNICVLIFCIPVITAGASVTAGYYMCFKMARNEDTYIMRGFWKSFKQNFKQSTAIWLIVMAVCAILYMDYRIVLYSGLEFSSWIRIGLITVTLIIALGFTFLFPMQARFTNTVKNTIKNAYLMALSHLPSSVLFVVSYAVPVALLYFFPQIFPLILLLAVGGLMYAKAFLYLRIFKKYEDIIIARQSQSSEQETDGDSGIFAESDAMESEMAEMAKNSKKKG